MKPVMFCRNTSGMRRWQQSSMKCAALSADSEKRMPLLATMPDRVAVDVREAAHERRAVELLELRELAAVHEPRDHFAHVPGLAGVCRNQAEQVLRRVQRLDHLAAGELRQLAAVQVGDRAARERERVAIVEREVIGDARGARMQLGAAELLGRHDLAGRRLHQRRAAEEDRALPFYDDASSAIAGT